MNLTGKSVGCKLSMDFFCKKTVSVIYLLEIGLTFRGKSLKIVLTEGWQSGNAPDSKSGEPMLNGRAGSNPVLSFFYTFRNVDRR